MNTKTTYLEHVNVTVSDIKKGIQFFKAAFPSFEVRGGDLEGARKWVHFGSEDTYIALNQNENIQGNHDQDYEKSGFNHVGFVVDDVKAVADRLEQNGFKRNYPIQKEKYRIRDYFGDTDGNQYEFVQYLSQAMEERNEYDA